ncbi:hypothetical protein HU200_029165 [Digitaria exilis]|uniref:Protein tyrosine phosphatase n=1 Tax=Digitaria exilis TaxID=1010633 RepID=A0A835BYV0_9POAL|nr:hypothetical protein HU200_029165 [Digitaria exilis]
MGCSPSSCAGAGRQCSAPPLRPPAFDPLDPDADPPPRALTRDQVRRCKKALKVLDKKLKPDAILQEYRSLPHSLVIGMPTRTSVWIYENRFNLCVFCFFSVNENRVRLQSSLINQTSTNDYINTDGKDQTKFICTQAPLPKTFEDFWQMVYENRCPVIVMVASVAVGKQCDEYLPLNKGQGDYGTFIVRIMKTKQTSHLVLRGLEVRHCKSDRVHSVLHIHYPEWPDHGVPDDSSPFRQIISRMYHVPREHQLIVHCSAGIGRTGTCITILNTVERILRGEFAALELVDTIRKFRNQRVGMISREVELYGKPFLCLCFLISYKTILNHFILNYSFT